jgi:zinc protease
LIHSARCADTKHGLSLPVTADGVVNKTGDTALNNKLRRVTVSYLTVLFLLALLSISALAKPQWQMVTLKNGLQVIVIENRSVPLVTVELAVKNGAWTEPPEYNGLSHLYEHMFFKSNAKSKAEGYHDQAAELGMLSNAQTQYEVVNYYTTTIRTGTREALRLLNDAIRYPLFDEQEFKQEIEVVLDELNRHASNPFYYIINGVEQKLWYKYYSRKNPGGNPETVSKATTEMMRTIQRKFYIPNNSALVVAGDVSAPDIFKTAEEVFGDWSRGEDPFIKNPIPRQPGLTKDEAVIVNQAVNAITLNVGYHGPSTDLDAPATYAADVFSFILRQPDSKFARALVDTGLTTGAAVGYLTQRNVGPITVTAQTTPQRFREAVKAINDQIMQFDAPDYFSNEELESAKTLIDVNEIYTREKPSEFAHVVSFWWASSGLDYYASYVEKVRQVTRADIQNYVRKYIKNRPRIYGVMLSAEDQKRLGLTDKDLLTRPDAVQPLKLPETPITSTAQPALPADTKAATPVPASKDTAQPAAGSGPAKNSKKPVVKNDKLTIGKQ